MEDNFQPFSKIHEIKEITTQSSEMIMHLLELIQLDELNAIRLKIASSEVINLILANGK